MDVQRTQGHARVAVRRRSSQPTPARPGAPLYARPVGSLGAPRPPVEPLAAQLAARDAQLAQPAMFGGMHAGLVAYVSSSSPAATGSRTSP